MNPSGGTVQNSVSTGPFLWSKGCEPKKEERLSKDLAANCLQNHNMFPVKSKERSDRFDSNDKSSPDHMISLPVTCRQSKNNLALG